MNNRVFIAVLNWGLGHASRSIPVIEKVIDTGADVVIASNGITKIFLGERFPHVNILEIPDKEISYHKTGAGVGLLKRSFQQKKINERQTEWMDENVKGLGITHIISDNLYGVFHPALPSAIITHQIGILSPFFKSRFDKYLADWLSKFDSVWIPDLPGENSLAGKMLENEFYTGKREFLGPISRFPKGEQTEKDIDNLVILSGPEPQRTFLETKLLKKLGKIPGDHVLVRGRIKGAALERTGNIRTYAFLHEKELGNLIQRAKLVICRSGYTSILDLVRLGAKALLIPTPQQPEQKYLAQRMDEKRWFRYVLQKDLKKKDLDPDYVRTPLPTSEFEPRLNQVIDDFLKITP